MSVNKSLLVRYCSEEPAPPSASEVSQLEDVLANSEEFNTKNEYPIESNLMKNLRVKRGDEVLLKNINSTYPLVHESVLALILDFLDLKQSLGSAVEKSVYTDMTVAAFIDRLLINRPLIFVGERDRYLLRDDPNRVAGASAVHRDKSTGKIISRKTTQTSSYGGFEKIGTKREEAPLLMKDYITYDEMKISALLATCSATCTINKGERRNCGRVETDEEFIDHAYICGLVGTRLVKTDVMDCQDMRVFQEQNKSADGPFYGKPSGSHKNSLGQVFAKFYNVPYFPLYTEVKRVLEPSVLQRVTDAVTPSGELNKLHFLSVQSLDKRRGTKKLKTEEFFNRHVYEERIRVTAETFLAEANHRAKLAGRQAYVHIVGLGLGVWKMLNVQHQMYVDVFGRALQKFKFEHISDVDFSWIPVKDCLGAGDGQVLEGTDITVRITQLDPYEKTEAKEGKIVIASWAYDGNSYPGNEFWAGSLHTSGDPQAACATQVPELHNPLVNPKMRGSSLHVVMAETGEVVSLAEYWKKTVAKSSKK